MDLGKKIREIKKIDKDNFSVTLIYDDGKIINVSLTHIFNPSKGLAKEILRGDMFDQCFIENGALAWPNGLELCPDALLCLSDNEELLSA